MEKHYKRSINNKEEQQMKKTLSVIVSIAIVMLAGCNSKNSENKSQNENRSGTAKMDSDSQSTQKNANILSGNWTTSNDVQSEITQVAKEKGTNMIDFIKSMGGKMTTSKNVEVYSLPNSKTCFTIPVVFNQEDPVANMRDFIDVVKEISDRLFMKPKIEDKKMGIFLGFAPDGNAVCGMSMYPQEQVFSLKGIDFMSVKAEAYSKAFDKIVKESTGKSSINEWDYYSFRSVTKPETGVLGDVCDRTIVCVAGTTIISLYKFKKEGFESTLLSNKVMAEQIFSAVTENEESQKIMKIGFSVNTVWFNSAGKRIMTEMARKIQSGEINKDRKWYNGYAMPQ